MNDTGFKQGPPGTAGFEYVYVSIMFRTAPTEYVYAHAVPVGRHPGLPGYDYQPAMCGRDMPDTMKADIDAFRPYVNTRAVDCAECIKALGATNATVEPVG